MADPPLFDLGPLRKALKQDGPRRGYLFHGPGEYLHRLALAELKASYGAGNYEVHLSPRKGDQPLPVRTLLADLVSPGLFAERKLVIFLDAKPLIEGHLEALEAALRGSGPGTVAISAPGKKTGAKKIHNLFSAHGQVFKTRGLYEKPGPWSRSGPETGELARWLCGRARERGKQLAPAHAWEMVCRIGTELFELDQEIEKLALAADGKQIDAAMIHEGVGYNRRYEVYELADALLSRDPRAAMALARQALLADPEHTKILLILLANLRNQVARLLAAKTLGSRPTVGEIMNELGMSKFAAARIVEKLPRFRSADELLALRTRLYEADRDLKQGRVGSKREAWLVERLLVSFCPGKTQILR